MSRYSFRLTVLLAAGMLAGGMTAFAQEKSQPTGMSPDHPLEVVSRLVTLDVVVVDQNGKFVTGLDQSKFHITDAKLPQKIRNFEAPEAHAMPNPGQAIVQSTEDLPKIGAAPVNVLVIDELNTPFSQIAYAQQMLTKYLKRQPAILAQPTLFIAVGSERVAVLHDFTQDRDALLASVKQHVTRPDFEFLVRWMEGGTVGPTRSQGRTLGPMLQLAYAMHGIPGRKNVIWVGTGYRQGYGGAYTQGDEISASRRVRMVTNQMLGAHITFYTIDPEGPAYHSNSPFPAGSPGAKDSVYSNIPGTSFDSFARSTGGTILFGRNDVETEVKESAIEGSQYYTMAYVPTGSGLAETGHPYHSIRVTVDDPNLRVITRDGYFGGTEQVERVKGNSAKKQPKMIRFDLLGAAITPMVYTGLHTEAATTKDGFALLVHGKDLHWIPEADGSQHTEVTVLAVCYGEKDKLLLQKASELTDVLDPNEKLGEQNRVGFNFPIEVPPGTRRIRFVLRDAESGTMGSADFQVPVAVAQK